MTNTEAKEIIIEEYEQMCSRDCVGYTQNSSNCLFCKENEAHYVVIKALEKQIPKPLQSQSVGGCYCGKCHSMFPTELYGVLLKYCPWCGQRIGRGD